MSESGAVSLMCEFVDVLVEGWPGDGLGCLSRPAFAAFHSIWMAWEVFWVRALVGTLWQVLLRAMMALFSSAINAGLLRQRGGFREVVAKCTMEIGFTSPSQRMRWQSRIRSLPSLIIQHSARRVLAATAALVTVLHTALVTVD